MSPKKAEKIFKKYCMKGRLGQFKSGFILDNGSVYGIRSYTHTEVLAKIKAGVDDPHYLEAMLKEHKLIRFVRVGSFLALNFRKELTQAQKLDLKHGVEASGTFSICVDSGSAEVDARLARYLMRG